LGAAQTSELISACWNIAAAGNVNAVAALATPAA